MRDDDVDDLAPDADWLTNALRQFYSQRGDVRPELEVTEEEIRAAEIAVAEALAKSSPPGGQEGFATGFKPSRPGRALS